MGNIRCTYISLLLTILLLLATAKNTTAQDITWHSFEDAIAFAQEKDRPILVDVWAPWCGWCHKMKKESYPALPAALKNRFVYTRLNRDERDTEYHYKGHVLNEMALAMKLNAQSVPTTVILSSDGEYLLHVSGYLTADKLEQVLRRTKQFTSRR